MSINIVIADDHTMLRDGLRSLINSQHDMVVVGEAGTGPEAIAQIRANEVDVLCLDLSMPGWGVATTIEQVRSHSPRTGILIVTMHADPAYFRAALAAGADGYVQKSAPAVELLAAVRSVAVGKPAWGELGEEQVAASTRPPMPRLSRREEEVLELLTQGHTHQEIADKLFLSVKTVETYRARLREKTGLKTRADFVRYGLERRRSS